MRCFTLSPIISEAPKKFLRRLLVNIYKELSVRRTRAFISFVLLLLKNLEYVYFFCMLKSLHRKNDFAEVSKNLARSEIILLDKIIM